MQKQRIEREREIETERERERDRNRERDGRKGDERKEGNTKVLRDRNVCFF